MEEFNLTLKALRDMVSNFLGQVIPFIDNEGVVVESDFIFGGVFVYIQLGLKFVQKRE